MPRDLKNAPPPFLRRLAGLGIALVGQGEGLALLTPRRHGILVGMGLAALLNFGVLKGWW